MWQGDFAEDEKYKKKFMELTKNMANIMSDFCLNALTSFSRVKGAPLNPLQIDQTIDFEIQSVIQQFNDPEILEIVRKMSRINFDEKAPFP